MFKKITQLILILLFSTMIISCSSSNKNSNNQDQIEDNDNNNSDESNIIDGIEIDDSFTSLNINDVNIEELELSEMDIESIELNSVLIDEIQTLDIEISTISDEMVYLVYKNFQDYFPEAINYDKLIKDTLIAGTCMIVMVSLSTVGGPIGTYFGAVICSEFTTASLLIGAAIDATISGIQAYKEGGDFEYILGHMINGVVDGIKYAALFAPISGAFSGIKSLRAVSKLKKVPGFDKITYKQANKIVKSFNLINNSTKGLSNKSTDDAINAVFNKLKKDLPSEINESIFKEIVRNKPLLKNIIVKYNPFNEGSKLIKSLKKDFLTKIDDNNTNNLSHIIKNIQNGSIKTFDEINDLSVKRYLIENTDDFLELFGTKINKSFLDSLIKKQFPEQVLDGFSSINKLGCYGRMFDSEDVKQLFDVALEQNDNLLLLQLRYGSKNVNNLIASKEIYNFLIGKNQISRDTVNNAIDKILNGTIKSLDDLSSINPQLAKNLYISRDVFTYHMKNFNYSKKLSSLIDDLSSKSIKEAINPSDMLHKLFADETIASIDDVIKLGLNKKTIIDKYGLNVYNDLLNNSDVVLKSLGLSVNGNKKLAQDLFKDSLLNKGISESSIKKIIMGQSLDLWDLSDNQISLIGNSVLNYYLNFDKKNLDNFANAYSKIRGIKAKEFAKQKGITIINESFAGKIKPADSKYILQKYGDIEYSENGFPIFDKYSKAIISSDLLTGDEVHDIKLMNLLHHGTTSTPSGYTWHHVEDGKTLILIPTDLHEAYRHTGGAKLIESGMNK